MLRIGEVEKITNVPSKTLRYWEEIGLITPKFVDRFTGYRGYDYENIEQIYQIVHLKNLGFSLNEIKNLDEQVVLNKTKELKNKLKKINQSIRKLSSFEFKEGEIIMKNFVNDPNAIGKWSLIGLAKTKKDVENNKLYSDEEYLINDLYLMEGGREYWVIGWSKGYIYIADRKNPYIIDGDTLIVSIGYYNNMAEFYAVYKRINSISYNPEDFITKDNIDLPFVMNKKMIGFWKSVCIVNKPEDYTPGLESKWKLWLKEIAISPNGTAILSFENNYSSTLKWTKDLILDDRNITASKCNIKVLNNEEYMFMEWKSGDYTYGGKIACYYVLKKLI